MNWYINQNGIKIKITVSWITADKRNLDSNSDASLYFLILKNVFGCRIISYTLFSEVSLFIETIQGQEEKSQVFRGGGGVFEIEEKYNLMISY